MNATDVRAKLSVEPTAGQLASISLVDSFGIRNPGSSCVPTWAVPSSAHDVAGLRRLEFWTRMLFSALIDADRLDTAASSPDSTARSRQSADRIDAETFSRSRRVALASHMADPVASARERVFHEVVSHTGKPPGWFELTAPTGSGKTLAALGFSFDHAARQGLRRVVSAVPFISVTEQVAHTYRSVLETDAANDVVLEHHSGVHSRGEGQTGGALWSRLAAENWDSNIIVTTTVRLLEALFENHTSDVRRLHRLADSVIVIDEVQSVPWRLRSRLLRCFEILFGCTGARSC